MVFSAPVVVLVRPQMGENIGAVARAMSNFGLSDLRLVAPRDGWPNRKALEMAAGGQSIVENATVIATLSEALAGAELAYATTARARDMDKRVILPQMAMREMHQHSASGQACALVFGPERTGLENDEVARCDTLITIPTAVENPSLNLAQAMVVLGYAWQCEQNQPCNLPSKIVEKLAPAEEFQGMLNQLEGYLDESGYFRVAARRPIMWRSLVNMFVRARLSEPEVRSLRGMMRCLYEAKET